MLRKKEKFAEKKEKEWNMNPLYIKSSDASHMLRDTAKTMRHC